MRFLYQTLRAAEWAKTNLSRIYEILEGETRAGAQGVRLAYRDGFHLSLAPDLSAEGRRCSGSRRTFSWLTASSIVTSTSMPGTTCAPWKCRSPALRAEQQWAAA